MLQNCNYLFRAYKYYAAKGGQHLAKYKESMRFRFRFPVCIFQNVRNHVATMSMFMKRYFFFVKQCVKQAPCTVHCSYYFSYYMEDGGKYLVNFRHPEQDDKDHPELVSTVYKKILC